VFRETKLITALLFLFLVFMFRRTDSRRMEENQNNNLTWKFSIAILLCGVREIREFEVLGGDFGKIRCLPWHTRSSHAQLLFHLYYGSKFVAEWYPWTSFEMLEQSTSHRPPQTDAMLPEP
jgi:hypothetical protein